MTLQDAANLAQVISAIAVVISLVYVAYEVRHNSRELRLSTQQAQADAATQYLIHLGTDPAFVELTERHTPPNVPSAIDQARVNLILHGVFVQFQAGWEAAGVERGALRRWWKYQEQALAGWLASPIIQEWWPRERLTFSEGFRQLVDARIEALKAPAG